MENDRIARRAEIDRTIEIRLVGTAALAPPFQIDPFGLYRNLGSPATQFDKNRQARIDQERWLFLNSVQPFFQDHAFVSSLLNTHIRRGPELMESCVPAKRVSIIASMVSRQCGLRGSHKIDLLGKL